MNPFPFLSSSSPKKKSPALRERSWTGDNSTGSLRERSFTGGSTASSNNPNDASDDDNAIPMVRMSPPRRLSSNGSHGHSTSASSSQGSLCRRLVHWIQQQHVPPSLLKRIRRSESDSTTYEKSPSVPWIAGLDRVAFGTQPAAEAIVLLGGTVRVPHYLWYMLSGFCCDGIQLVLDVLLHKAVGVADASTCWALTFCASILFRHSFHRYMVFGDYVGGYWYSLLRMYGGYSVSIVLSTAFNRIVTSQDMAWWNGALLTHYQAWVCTLLWTGIANYFILKKLWSFGGSKPQLQRGKESSSGTA